MKRISILLLALLAATVGAQSIAVNGAFKQTNGNLPAGWEQNKEEWAKPLGSISVLQNGEGKNYLKISAGPKSTGLFYQSLIPCLPDDRFTVTVRAGGKGTAKIGFYCYDGASTWLFGDLKEIALTDEVKEYQFTFPIQPRAGKTPGACRLALVALPNSVMNCESIAVSLE